MLLGAGHWQGEEQPQVDRCSGRVQALQLLEPGSDIADIVDRVLTRDDARCCEPRSTAVKNYAEHYQRYQQAVSAVTSLYQ